MNRAAWVTCKNCALWDNTLRDLQALGTCRRHAPQPYLPVPPHTEAPRMCFPKTSAEDGCAEGETKKKRAPRGVKQ